MTAPECPLLVFLHSHADTGELAVPDPLNGVSGLDFIIEGLPDMAGLDEKYAKQFSDEIVDIVAATKPELDRWYRVKLQWEMLENGQRDPAVESPVLGSNHTYTTVHGACELRP